MCKHEMPERGHCLRCGCEVCTECALPGELGPTCGPCVEKEEAWSASNRAKTKAHKVPAPQPRDGYHGEEPDPLRPAVEWCRHGVLNNTVCLYCMVASAPRITGL